MARQPSARVQRLIKRFLTLAKKTNYDFIKRQKELEKKRKQEEKQQRKRETSTSHEDLPVSTEMKNDQ